ncbi:MAG: GFA family protein [Caulobacteraceae bacterium]
MTEDAAKDAARDANVRTGQCHCGAVRFKVKLTDGFNTRRRCTCSYCRMRGAVAVSADLGGITFLSGEDKLSSYRFNTGSAQHFFCSKCGIYTHHQRRSNQQQYGVNVACLEGISPFDFAEVPVLDGLNHPNDVGSPAVQVGTLKFEPMG